FAATSTCSPSGGSRTSTERRERRNPNRRSHVHHHITCRQGVPKPRAVEEHPLAVLPRQPAAEQLAVPLSLVETRRRRQLVIAGVAGPAVPDFALELRQRSCRIVEDLDLAGRWRADERG